MQVCVLPGWSLLGVAGVNRDFGSLAMLFWLSSSTNPRHGALPALRRCDTSKRACLRQVTEHLSTAPERSWDFEHGVIPGSFVWLRSVDAFGGKSRLSKLTQGM